ncbi:MAG: precorrin-4 C(11)-methyltransferase [Desulfotomaculales bacterium]
MAKVYFIGAGPGDPELLTLKAVEVLRRAGTVIYAGSLVNREVLRYAGEKARLFDSAGLTLEEIAGIMESAVAKGEDVARLHSGDPSLYGAIAEQMEVLAEKGIPYEVIPGVSSFLAAAAFLGREYTVPEVSQTVIVTRVKGRTGVPEKERLSALAAHRSSMCIFLSVHMIDEVVAQLKEGYPPQTPVAVVERVSWPDGRAVFGTLDNIAALVKAEKIEKTALILVGEFLTAGRTRSRLYAADFAHGFRGGRK